MSTRGTSAVWLFLLLTFALSWPLLIYGFGWLDVSTHPLQRYLVSCAGMCMVALSALLTRGFERAGFEDVGWSPGRCRWYAAALLGCMLLWLGPPLAASVTGQLQWNRDLGRDAKAVVTLSLAGVSVLAGFGEEFGWRGYLLPRLLSRPRMARGALLMVGVVWGVWHCATVIGPLLRAAIEGTSGWLPILSSALTGCVRAVGTSIALSFIFGALWLRSRSIILLAFLHGCWIGIRDSAAHLLRYPAAFRLITMVVIVVYWFMADRWLREYERVDATHTSDREA